MQITDGLPEVLGALLIVAHHGLNGAHHVSAGIDAILMVVGQGMLLHVLGGELSPVALLVVGEIECLIGPGLVEGTLVASLLGRLLQSVGHVDEGRLVVLAVELVHLFLQLRDVIGSDWLCRHPEHARRKEQKEKDELCHILHII